MGDDHGGKIVFRSAVDRITTVFNILDTIPLSELAPVKPAKPAPIPTAAQRSWEAMEVEFEQLQAAGRKTMREDHRRQLSSLPRCPIVTYDPQELVSTTPQPWATMSLRQLAGPTKQASGVVGRTVSSITRQLTATKAGDQISCFEHDTPPQALCLSSNYHQTI